MEKENSKKLLTVLISFLTKLVEPITIKNILRIALMALNIRLMDDFGSELFNTPRGKEKHNGIDFICKLWQIIVSLVDGTIIRKAFPYPNKEYAGIPLENDSIILKMFYLTPDKKILGLKVKQGDKLGIAQDISKLYNSKAKKMIPHTHLQIEGIDPTVLML